MIMPGQIAIRPKDYNKELLAELDYHRVRVLNSTPSTLWLLEDEFEPAWADCVWRSVQALPVESIADAHRKLKAISKDWTYYGDLFHRRGELIAEGLVSQEPPHPFHFPTAERGTRRPAFTLATPQLIYYSQDVQRPTADGRIPFQENNKIPPSRAYLKLWEALTLLGDWPRMKDHVVDLGSSPGSWSWALARQHAQVLSIDRSELSEKVMQAKNIEFRRGDAFAFAPTKMDWVFSDVICFPEKLYDYIQTWLASGLCEKFVCNVKFAGEVDPQVVDRFRKIPHSRVVHLLNGKKEVTWIRHPKIDQKIKASGP